MSWHVFNLHISCMCEFSPNYVWMYGIVGLGMELYNVLMKIWLGRYGTSHGMKVLVKIKNHEEHEVFGGSQGWG